MFALFWNLSSMRFYMPTNRAVDWLRSPSGIKWAIPLALVATPAYLFAIGVCATIVERGGPGWLNLLVLLFAVTPVQWLSRRFRRSARTTSNSRLAVDPQTHRGPRLGR
jgi:phosphotransferase system  glucose/maltose/N-acetylglucosamine-specific IIC component